MNVRRAGPDDYEAISALWRDFDHEIPPPIHEGPADQEKELAEVAAILASEVAFLAEDDDGAPVGFALARRRTATLGTLTDLYVKQEARRSGIGTELMREVLAAFRALGVEMIDLEVVASNTGARSLYGRWGFRDDVVVMTGTVADLEVRLGAQEASSFGAIHIQSDDLSAVEQAVRQFVPRLPGGSRGSLVVPPRNGWTAVYDDVCDRNPDMLRRLARELSDRIGAVTLLLGVERDELVRMILFERGRIVDEYLSVPEFYGPLPPGDVVGLAANPTVVSRLTGADPEAVRRIARTAPAPADLPPARELLADFAGALGIEGARTRLGGRARSRRRRTGRARMKVILLHGWPLSERMWVPQVTALRKNGFEPIVPHLYGRGPSIDGWASQLLRDYDGTLVAVGASMGGYCALALARRAPERVVGMALVASRAGADTFDRRRQRDDQITALRARGMPGEVETDESAEDLAVAQEAMRNRMDLSGVVASFGGPLLVCIGDQDDVVSVDESRELVSGALRGTLEVFPGAGHFISVEQPDRFNAVLLEFLSQWQT